MRDAYTYLIIGGGIAGVAAAETIRGRDRDGSIAILSSEPYPLYSRVLLPRFVAGDIPREKLFLRSEDDYARLRIDFLPERTVSFVHTAKREVGLSDHTVIGYKKLLVASGGETAPSSLDGYADYVHRLQTIDDADRLREAFRKNAIRRPLILGGSFIALEFASLAARFGARARVLFRREHFFSRIMGPTGGEFMKRLFTGHGIEVSPKEEVTDAAEGEGFLRITTSRLSESDHDAVLLGIGLKRNIDFLAGSGVPISDGVETNEFLETVVPGVYAAGDVAAFFDVLFGRRRIVGNWTNAFLQGKLAGLNMTGERLALRVVSSYSTTHFGLPFVAIGDPGGEGVIEHVDFRKNAYVRYAFSKEGKCLESATLVNRNDIRQHVSALIESKTPAGEFREKLKNASFDIREVSVVPSN